MTHHDTEEIDQMGTNRSVVQYKESAGRKERE